MSTSVCNDYTIFCTILFLTLVPFQIDLHGAVWLIKTAYIDLNWNVYIFFIFLKVVLWNIFVHIFLIDLFELDRIPSDMLLHFYASFFCTYTVVYWTMMEWPHILFSLSGLTLTYKFHIFCSFGYSCLLLQHLSWLDFVLDLYYLHFP